MIKCAFDLCIFIWPWLLKWLLNVKDEAHVYYDIIVSETEPDSLKFSWDTFVSDWAWIFVVMWCNVAYWHFCSRSNFLNLHFPFIVNVTEMFPVEVWHVAFHCISAFRLSFFLISRNWWLYCLFTSNLLLASAKLWLNLNLLSNINT